MTKVIPIKPIHRSRFHVSLRWDKTTLTNVETDEEIHFKDVNEAWDYKEKHEVDLYA